MHQFYPWTELAEIARDIFNRKLSGRAVVNLGLITKDLVPSNSLRGLNSTQIYKKQLAASKLWRAITTLFRTLDTVVVVGSGNNVGFRAGGSRASKSDTLADDPQKRNPKKREGTEELPRDRWIVDRGPSLVVVGSVRLDGSRSPWSQGDIRDGLTASALGEVACPRVNLTDMRRSEIREGTAYGNTPHTLAPCAAHVDLSLCQPPPSYPV